MNSDGRAPLRVEFLSFLILIVVGCSTTTSARTRLVQYRVLPGETLSQISMKFNVSEREIRQLNSLGNAPLNSRLYVLLPDRGQRELKLAPTVQPVLAKHASTRAILGNLAVGRLPVGRAKQFVGKLQWPTDAPKLGSRFGARSGSFHEGIDLGATEGQPVLSAHDGTIAFSGQKLSGYGNMIIVKGDGILTIYAHNSRNRVRAGQTVRVGERIADAGQSGRATSPHVHFEVRLQDEKGRYTAVDPLMFLSARG